MTRTLARPAAPAPFVESGEGLLLDRLFIGAGAMKAGTTWAYQVLERHPDIFFSFEKEIHYFYAAHVDRAVLSDRHRMANVRDKYLRIDPERMHASGVRNRLRWAANYLDGPVDDHWYRSLFLFRRAERFAADFSNLYALLPADVWRRIAARVGELRVLYTMRPSGPPALEPREVPPRGHRAVGRPRRLGAGAVPRLRIPALHLGQCRVRPGPETDATRPARAAPPLKPVFYEEIHADRAGFSPISRGFLVLPPMLRRRTCRPPGQHHREPHHAGLLSGALP